jgi:hypothetical protein
LKLNVQQVIIEKLFVHPLMQNMLPDYPTNLQCLKAHEELMSNFEIWDHMSYNWSTKGISCGYQGYCLYVGIKSVNKQLEGFCKGVG